MIDYITKYKWIWFCRKWKCGLCDRRYR